MKYSTKDGKYYYLTPYSCGLIVLKGGRVVDSAPIFYKMRGNYINLYFNIWDKWKALDKPFKFVRIT